MTTQESTDHVIAETERLRGELTNVVARLDTFTADLLAEVAARTTPPSTEDDPQ